MNISVIVNEDSLIQASHFNKLITINKLPITTICNITKSTNSSSWGLNFIHFYESFLNRTTKKCHFVNKISSDCFCLNLSSESKSITKGLFNIKINGIPFAYELDWFNDIIVNKRNFISVSYTLKEAIGIENEYEFKTRPDYLFLFRTRHEILSKLLTIIYIKSTLGNLVTDSVSYLSNDISTSKLFYRLMKNLFAKTIDSLFYKTQWQIQYKLIDSIDEWITLVPPKDRFWADPFLVEEAGKYFLFVEELIYKKGFAHLSVMEVDEKGIVTDSEIILDKGHHLSYPYVFLDNGQYFMIPETAKSETIELYKCIEFPYKWEFSMNLMEGILASDTSVVKHDGLWWLFTSEKKLTSDGYDSYLSIYYSDDLLTNNWTPVKNNPVKVDVRDSRCGGYIYEKDNELFRVSQNCSKCYGYGYNIAKITELSSSVYKEDIIDIITADQLQKGIIATHTFSVSNELVTRDILKRIKG
ncbi:hypothetical protein EV201_1130 [Ancylomarina subtilis]|uniref:Glucosamine inositolphosphorylceramide transferase 1 N-terminal domain-containing protein n=1 Tax=Ancylomarina subtilis TaxID=1639035 RepID=A0A4Q7VJY1_9BACT|nr:hypothetical protein [Ancylomarina subtilis]RZT96492.1 hypothetical protein EV201_1130 [Ancylomarina subtilis]